MYRDETTMPSSPIVPKEPERPVVPMERWMLKPMPPTLVKKYSFRQPEHRVRFVMAILSYEGQVGHKATLLVEPELVTVSLRTPGIESITELDKEFASYCDLLYKDISIS
jgi:Pterin-4a-carbinolamine dehydratase